ncbi:protease HtpX [Candidatus Gracilibacteria bacterium]|nr:protease HtpX [Candidatus Gracilibacteria bacterium]
MTAFKRIFFWFLINAAVIAVIMTIVSVFGLDIHYLKPYGLDLKSLAILSLLWGFAGSFISLCLSKFLAKRMLGVKIIDQPQNHDEIFLTEIIGRLASQGGFKTPEIGIYASPEVNAFATGATKNSSLVAVSQGLLNEMDKDEIEGVIAHEMAHIQNGDMVTMALLQGVINAFVIFFARVAAYAVQTALGKSGDEIGGLAYWVTSILFEILFSALASVIVFAFSRWREYRADFGGASFVGKQKMIAALKRLQNTQNKIDSRQKSLSTMKIANKASFARFFSTHPRLDDRIKRLQQAPIS